MKAHKIVLSNCAFEAATALQDKVIVQFSSCFLNLTVCFRLHPKLSHGFGEMWPRRPQKRKMIKISKTTKRYSTGIYICNLVSTLCTEAFITHL